MGRKRREKSIHPIESVADRATADARQPLGRKQWDEAFQRHQKILFEKRCANPKRILLALTTQSLRSLVQLILDKSPTLLQLSPLRTRFAAVRIRTGRLQKGPGFFRFQS